MTTEPAPTAAGGLSGLSVRTRIVAVVAALTGLALAAAGLLVYTLESARIEEQVAAHLDQEIEEFRTLQRGQDPATARPFTSVEALIDLFLRRNVPDDDETLIGFWDGAARVSSESPHPGFATTSRLADTVRSRLATGGTARLDSPFGEVIVTVVPVSNDETMGPLVINN